MKKLAMPTYRHDTGPASASTYPSRFMTPHYQPFGHANGLAEASATQDEVRFTVRVDETPFEFLITRQALEDLAHGADAVEDLLSLFQQNRERIESIALDRIDSGLRWPHLVIRMQDLLVYTEV